MSFKKRLISAKIDRALKTFPVVVLAGARQTGKSMLLKNDPQLKSRPYFTCDDPQTMLTLTGAGEEFLRAQQVLNLDEAQRVPKLFLDLKRIVDDDRRRGRFLISGSAQFLLLRDLGDSLAGRAGYVRMLPVSLFELLETPGTPTLHSFFESRYDFSVFTKKQFPEWSGEWLVRGGYPEVAWDSSIDLQLWFKAYEATYLERDIRTLAGHLDPLAYQRFLRIAAARNGSLLNQSEIARDAGLNNVTCGRYIHLLEISGLINRIQPFFDNVGKRYVKSPKLLFTDMTLAAYLSGAPHALNDDKHPRFGHCVESFVLQNLLVLADAYLPASMNLFHLRTASGFEIDAIVELGGDLVGIEVKSARSIGMDDALNLRKFMEINPACKAGIVAYRGDRVLPLYKNIWAVPIAALLT
jgi:uncharacterized protein